MTASKSIARPKHANRKRKSDGLPEFDFGIALNVGSVIYRNVGTAKRLDFTATGAAVGLASRIEGLTRDLEVPLIATADFAEVCDVTAKQLGPYPIRGFCGAVELVTYTLS